MTNSDEHTPETSTPDGGGTADSTSDPGLDSGAATDWSSEGGAVREGPATDADDDEDAEKPGSLGGDNGGA